MTILANSYFSRPFWFNNFAILIAFIEFSGVGTTNVEVWVLSNVEVACEEGRRCM